MPPRLSYSTSDATSLESQTRTDLGFPDVEASLVSIGAAKVSGTSKLQDILSYLGPKNPLPAPITKNDAVWLMDNTAYRGPTGSWHAEFVAAAFSAHVHSRFVDAVGDIAGAVGLSKGDKEEAVIEKRIVPFVMDILPGRQVKAVFEDSARLRLGPGGRNGISSDVKKLHSVPKRTIGVTTADVPEETTGILEAKTFFAEPEGWSIISGTRFDNGVHPRCRD